MWIYNVWPLFLFVIMFAAFFCNQYLDRIPKSWYIGTHVVPYKEQHAK